MARRSRERRLKGELLGRHLQRARGERGLTQRQLAARCAISQPRISQFESGEVTPSLEQLLRLAEALQVPVQFFLTGGVRPGGELPDLAVELFALGVRDLLLGEVVTSTDEHHLVLVARTSAADFVLDNLQPNVRDWGEVTYRWVRIQMPNSNHWASIEPIYIERR